MENSGNCIIALFKNDTDVICYDDSCEMAASPMIVCLTPNEPAIRGQKLWPIFKKIHPRPTPQPNPNPAPIPEPQSCGSNNLIIACLTCLLVMVALLKIVLLIVEYRKGRRVNLERHLANHEQQEEPILRRVSLIPEEEHS